MILHLDPQTPVVVRDAATAMLYSHIGGALVGLVSGGAALFVRKGQRLHRLAGDLFFVAMLTMSGVGALVAPFLSEGQAPNTMMGAFTFYLVSTGWAVVRREPHLTGRFEIGAAAFAAILAAGGVAYAWWNSQGPHPLPFPEGPVIDAFAVLVSLAAVLDIRAIRAGGLTGPARVIRHLWRMTLALLIAAASFAGQPKVIPPFLRDSPLVLLPAIVVLVSLIYWLVRIRLAPALRRNRAQPISRSLEPVARGDVAPSPVWSPSTASRGGARVDDGKPPFEAFGSFRFVAGSGSSGSRPPPRTQGGAEPADAERHQRPGRSLGNHGRRHAAVQVFRLGRNRVEIPRKHVAALRIGEIELNRWTFGASHPIAPNDTALGRGQNRRVELIKD